MCRDTKESRVASLPPEYLEGIALFNRREFHQAHDAWEKRWLQLRTEGYANEHAERLFLQALIQASVAFYHLENGRTKSAREMYRRAADKFRRLDAKVFMQLDVTEFLAQLECSLAWLDEECESNEHQSFDCSQSADKRTRFDALKFPTLRLLAANNF